MGPFSIQVARPQRLASQECGAIVQSPALQSRVRRAARTRSCAPPHPDTAGHDSQWPCLCVASDSGLVAVIATAHARAALISRRSKWNASFASARGVAPICPSPVARTTTTTRRAHQRRPSRRGGGRATTDSVNPELSREGRGGQIGGSPRSCGVANAAAFARGEEIHRGEGCGHCLHESCISWGRLESPVGPAGWSKEARKARGASNAAFLCTRRHAVPGTKVSHKGSAFVRDGVSLQRLLWYGTFRSRFQPTAALDKRRAQLSLRGRALRQQPQPAATARCGPPCGAVTAAIHV